MERRAQGLPRYLDIAARLQRDLAAGRWRPGDRLPSIAALASEFRVTPITAREALRVIESHGMIECRHGSGTYVSQAAVALHAVALRSDLASIAAALEHAEPVEIAPPRDGASAPVPPELRSAPAYQRLYRVAHRDGAPYVVADVWLDARLYRRSPARYDRHVALAVLMASSAGREARRWRQVLTIDVAGPRLAGLLGRTPHSPVAEVHTVLADARDTAIYLGTLTFPADLVRVEFDSERERSRGH